MEIRARREDFLSALSRTQGTVERRNTMPILANVLIETHTNRIRVTATDLEVGVRASLNGEIVTSGRVTVDARKLYEIVRELSEEMIELQRLENDRVEIRSGKSVFKMVGLDAQEFPVFAQSAEGDRKECPAQVLKEMIDKTIFSVSTDETRSNLNGALLHESGDNTVRMVTTDGHRLSLVQREIGPLGIQKGVIIPRKGLGEIRRLLEDSGEATVSLGLTENMVFVWYGDVEMSIRLIDGEFPDYDKVIPSDHTSEANVAQSNLFRALRRVSLLSSDRYRGVRVELKGGGMFISANNPDLGEAAEELDVDYQGARLSIGYNAQYLLDILGVLEHDDKVTLAVKDDQSPTVLKRNGDESLLYVVMPMRI
ncbi:MAG: DNA polymerase III subunit beta [Deltaproteobacteria bacterium]|nr:DNA polymerase III subunit beta [Deltaproteobacteria bacterium]